ncbi:hypothetical protein APICC_08306 [Apis cerana cerana]|uniref:Tetratricopeptide repeat protein 29 n=1 Tax=Apis cerana cerana TaxID=94128 RepID=A0A2A3ELM5_APICC|nr:hypothetical protein APICC_08306 [Apis cerana cerana]
MTEYDEEKKYDITEFLKKDYKEWSNTSESYITNPRLKTLPQAHGKEIYKIMDDLKAALPNISPRELRRFYTPFHEAILCELEEEGYHIAYNYMKEILDLDEKIVEKTVLISWKKPYLKDQKEFILFLKDGLIQTEKCRREDDYIGRAISLLDMALFFQTKTWEWWWVTEQLYQAALSAAEWIVDDDNETITLIRYLYGRFLFYELEKPKEAITYLEKARKDSKDKYWNASYKLQIKQYSIFVECNILLYKGLLILVRKIRPENPERALSFCIKAEERALDAQNTEYMNEVLYELGKCYAAVNDMKNALHNFSKLLALARRISDAEGVCNAHMQLAFTYKQLNDDNYTEKHLQKWRESAEDFGLIEKLADAHYYTGEHFLNQRKLHLSTGHLETAFSLYSRLGLFHEADRARCIAGISKGQEKIEKYIDLLLRCGEYDQNATLDLCQWKSHRKPFWIEEEKIIDIKSDLEIEYENADTISSSLSFTKA